MRRYRQLCLCMNYTEVEKTCCNNVLIPVLLKDKVIWMMHCQPNGANLRWVSSGALGLGERMRNMELTMANWLVIVAVMLVIEIFTMGLTTIWFSIGALAAAAATGLGAPLGIQILLFVVVSLLVMFLVRPFAMRMVNREHMKTNIDAVVGEQAVVQETIDNRKEQGKVVFRGVDWMARSIDNTLIPEGELVEIEEISGVKLVVKRIQ